MFARDFVGDDARDPGPDAAREQEQRAWHVWRERHRRRLRRGSASLFFLYLIPILFGIAGLTIDAARLYDARRSLHQALDAAALSGATEFDLSSNQPRLNPTLARRSANQVMAANIANGVIRGDDTRWSPPIVSAGDTRVTVRGTTVVNDLLFMGYFIPSYRHFLVRAEGTADVCLALDAGSSCTKPDASHP